MTAPLPPLQDEVEKAMQAVGMYGPIPELRLAIRKALADEREACLAEARKFEDEANLPGGVNKGGPIARGYTSCAWFIAAAIRARPVSHE